MILSELYVIKKTMPIKPENKNRYPANWTEIVKRIRKRSKGLCEKCGVRNYSVGYRDEYGDFISCSGNVTMEDYGQGINPNTGKELTFKESKEMAEWQTQNDEYGYKYIVIVLTVAHKDHIPENCSDENLADWCQKCHNTYDAPHRKETRLQTRNLGNLIIEF